MKKKILLPVSPAELMDKISILEIKTKKISDPEKLKNVKHELEILMQVFKKNIDQSKELTHLFDKLRKLSAKGWKIEDIKRDCERVGDFSSKFIEAARGAFKNNDERAALWKKINLLLKSDIVQEKSYKKY
jgi:hypothetical protein